MERLLEGKTAIVTGANRGIGKAIVEAMAKQGCNVFSCARQSSDKDEKSLLQLEKQYGVFVKPIYFDLCDYEQVEQKIKPIIKEFDIDILVNNAGEAHSGILQMTSVQTVKDIFEVNYFSMIHMIQLVSKKMMRLHHGSIINMASVGGIETNPGYLAYGSSKAAVIWMSQSVAKELGVHGIRVNAVAPGLTNTRMKDTKSEIEQRRVIEKSALKRAAEPSEIADAVVYLASEQASYVTGQVLRVDGGRV